MQEQQSPSMAQYSQWLSEGGETVYPGSQGTIWKELGKGSVMRLPKHATHVPTRSELRNIFLHKYFVANYVIQPDARHPANRWLYLADKTYDFEKLSKTTRRDTRRAQRELRFAELSWDELRQHGAAAYCQTNARHRLPETTDQAFLAYVDMFSRNPAHHVMGAWLEDRLIAFQTIAAVEDWVEGVGFFSTDGDRIRYPSEGLHHYTLERFVLNQSYRVMCIGWGNLPGEGPGLHPYKVKIGFKAVPVHGVFATPVWTRPLLNPFVLASAKWALRLRPRNYLLHRIIRVLEQITSAPLLRADHEVEKA